MNITEKALKNPAGAAVAIAIVLFFGIFSLSKLPIQLFPDIENPEISIQTGAAHRPKKLNRRVLSPLKKFYRACSALRLDDSQAVEIINAVASQ